MTKQEWARFAEALRLESSKCYTYHKESSKVLEGIYKAALVMSTDTKEEAFYNAAIAADESR